MQSPIQHHQHLELAQQSSFTLPKSTPTKASHDASSAQVIGFGRGAPVDGDGGDMKEGRISRVEQQSLLMTKLPSELHREVFDLLGPASQRLLGATCSSLYRMYKEHYYEKDIVVSFGNDNLIGASGTTQYRDILAQWLIPTSFNVSRWDRCYYYGQLWNKMYANCSKKAKYNGTPYLYMEEERVKSGKGFLKF